MNTYASYYVMRCNKTQIEPVNNFIIWVNCVENQVQKKLGCGLLDLPDEMYYVNFEYGVTSKDMANQVIENNVFSIQTNQK